MYSSREHQGFSGQSYDRWSYEQNGSAGGKNESTINKLQHKYWVAKQAVARKFGKDEDEHIAASDSELDAKLELFKSVKETTLDLQILIEQYQDRLCNLSYEENALGRFLKDYGKSDKTRAGKMMSAVGKTMSYSGQQRLSIRVPIVRLHQEVETFKRRAIEDTQWTVTAMEKNRTEYRGSLMWMKKISQELDPDTYNQLEKFRKVQTHVKKSKAKFDKCKLDCLQKVDLLAASRCNMFSYALILYQDALITFWEKTSRTMAHVNETFKGYQPYEFSYIKDLVEPPERRYSFAKEAVGLNQEKENLLNNPKSNSDESHVEDATTPNLVDLSMPSHENAPNSFDKKIEEDELLLDIDDELADDKIFDYLPIHSENSREFTKKPKVDNDDALLLEELMNGPQATSLEDKDEFSAQWDEVFGRHNQPEKSSDNNNIPSGLEGLSINTLTDIQLKNTTQIATGDLLGKLGSSSNSGRGYLPSQLFEIDQTMRGSEDISHFPMSGPLTTSTFDDVLSGSQKKLSNNSNKSSDMSQWFSLFADLDPLSNPDAIGKDTKQTDRNIYS
uniref:Islet cell autoantigen 1, 69kDa [Taeniopygia guttata] n=1 Tax=Lepeophtheirus salmonis TaxID=72036 RepID=A0A0K2T6C0_LEPSM